MARRKTAQKSRKQGAREPIQVVKFPADQLPSELIHMVFEYLKPTEVAAFRWTGRTAAVIGLQYLVPTVYLRLNVESYDRLVAIAGHPVVSKYVIKLEYENESLGQFRRRAFDEVFVRRRRDSEQLYSGVDARAGRASRRESTRKLTQLSDEAWSIYKAYRASERKIQEANFFRNKLTGAMKEFPKLKTISKSTKGICERYVNELNQLLPPGIITNRREYGAYLDADLSSAILLAAETAGLHISSLSCRGLPWGIFPQDQEIVAASKKSIVQLKTLDVQFDCPNFTPWHRYFDSTTPMRNYLEFVTSAPNLEYLGLSFKDWRNIHPSLNEVTSNFYWPCLKAIKFESLSTDQDDLVRFCERHTHTLRDISLTDMRLFVGSWSVVFHKMRRAFRFGQQLGTCKLYGQFQSPMGYLQMCLFPYCDQNEKTVNSRSKMISNYLLDSDIGDITLDDYVKLLKK